MIKNMTFLFAFMFMALFASAQSTSGTKSLMAEQAQPTSMAELPFRQIPDAPESYTAETVAARMVDGLGFRYYWATEELRSEDLNYRIVESARTMQETLDHIYGLSKTIINAVLIEPNVRSQDEPTLTWEEKRAATLQNLKKASDILRTAKTGSMDDYKIIFVRDDNTSDFPYWNMINGPIADAIWHTGQVVSFRRAAGNPFPPGVSVLRGKRFE